MILFFSRFLLNRMHQKVHVRFLRNTIWFLINRLYRERFLFLGQDINSEISNQIVGLCVFLSIEDGSKDLNLFINCPGGEALAGIALYDIMQSVRPEVRTIGMGLTASMGSFILVGGQFTQRHAFPHAWRQWVFYLIWEKKKENYAFAI